jgi:HEPN domain-containing protein
MSREKFTEIEKFYSKASSVLEEAREQAKKFNYDLCVRRSQESFELYLKTMFKFIEKDYPQEHDISKEIYKVLEALKKFGFTAQKIAQIVHRNHTLTLWRDKSFYGDEKLDVTSIFTEGEAKLALSYAENISSDCYSIRYKIIQQLNS